VAISFSNILHHGISGMANSNIRIRFEKRGRCQFYGKANV